jgi:hypothetical protein
MPAYVKRTVTRRYTAAGAIDLNATHVELASSAGAAMTLANPPNTAAWNGHQMTIQCTTAQAHTITNTTGFNEGSTSSDVITLDAKNEAAVIEARNGAWWLVSLLNGGVA